MNDMIALNNLLTQAASLPCSNGAHAFLSLLTSDDDRLSLAINGLIPALQNQNFQIPQRILAAYVLDALYVSLDRPNPFYDYLLRAFESEKDVAVAILQTKLSFTGSSRRAQHSPYEGNGNLHAGNEQLIWILWKILKGEGADLSPYSPNVLSRTTLPEHLQAVHLVLQQPVYNDGVQSEVMYSPTAETSRLTRTSTIPITSHQNTTTLFRSDISTNSRSLHVTPRLASPGTPFTSDFSPFDDAFPDSSRSEIVAGRPEGEWDGWLGEVVPNEVVGKQSQHLSSGHTSFQSLPPLVHPAKDTCDTPLLSHNSHFAATADQRRQALLRALCEEPFAQSGAAELIDGSGGVGIRSKVCQNVNIRRETSRIPPQLQTSLNQVLPPTQFSTIEHPTRDTSRQEMTSLDMRRPSPIARPCPTRPSCFTASPTSPASPAEPIFSTERTHEVTQTRAAPPQETRLRVNGVMPPAATSPLVCQTSIVTPIHSLQPRRSPGVIGSGRPSSKNTTFTDVSPIEHQTHVSAIGSGRPQPSMVITDISQSLTSPDTGEKHDGMIPFSVLRMRKAHGDSERGDLGAIGQPKNGRLGRERSVDGRSDALGVSARMEAASLSLDRHHPAHFFAGEKHISSSGSTSSSPYPPNFDATEPTDTVQQQVALRHPMPSEPRAVSFNQQPMGVSVPPTSSDVRDAHFPVSSPSRLPTEHFQLQQHLETPQASQTSILEHEDAPETQGNPVGEKSRNDLSRAIVLLLSARERVLTLPEQRMLQPHLSLLTQPLSLLRPNDLPPLVAKNPDIAAKLLVLLLDRKDEDSAIIEHMLTEASKNEPTQQDPGEEPFTSFGATPSINPRAAVPMVQTAVEFVTNYGSLYPTHSKLDNVSAFGGREARERYLEALKNLPPTMQSFNLIAKLLRPVHLSTARSQKEEAPEVTVARLIKTEVLGGLVSGCVRWIEQAAQEEKEGEVHDDRVAVAVSSLCRFYLSLLKHGFVSTASEVDTTEIMSFTLQFSRFEEARSLYSTLAAARL